MTMFGRNKHIQIAQRYKLQPGVTPQVKSFLHNLRSTVKVGTMRLQGPHKQACTIYRGLFFRSLHIPHFLPTCQPLLPMYSESFSTSAQSNQTLSKYCNVITRTPCFLFLPPCSLLSPFPTLIPSQGKEMRPNFLFSLMRLNQCNDAGSCL